MPTLPLENFNYDILELMDDNIGLAAPAPANDRGEQVYAPPTYYKGKVEYETREVRMNTGEERVAHANIYVAPVQVNITTGAITYLTDLPPATPEYQITMPDGSNPVILRVDKAYYGDMSHLLIYT